MAATALVEEDNTFRFEGLETGNYFVVVAFPSMLDGYKVAWQVPVQVAAQRTAAVTLNRGNLALPTFSRRHGTTVMAAGR